MNYYTPSQILRIEEYLIETLEVPERLLMENAGGASAKLIDEFYPEASRAVILTGPGKNGGDGFVAARHLQSAGWSVQILSAVQEESIKGISRINYDLVGKCGIPVLFSNSLSDIEIRSMLTEHEVIVDGLLGIGSNGPPRGEISRLISLSRGLPCIVALDLPSGVDPQSGKILSQAISAEHTLTMIEAKTCLALSPGSDHSGQVTVVDLGFPNELELRPVLHSFTEDDAKSHLPSFHGDIHKGDRGGVLIIGGSEIYRGAPVLSARGFLRSGGGLAVLFSEDVCCSACAASLPETIAVPGFPGAPKEKIIETITMWKNRAECMVIGPGMGRSKRAGEAFLIALSAWDKKIIVDGDGLYWLGEFGTQCSRKGDMLLTPHEGEAARLLGLEPGEVKSERSASVRKLAEKWGTVLLKGRETLVDDGRRTFLVAEGNRSLAVPGSGDVLAGISAFFISSGISIHPAASLAAFIHGRAGNRISTEKGLDGVLASEIADVVPQVLREMRQNRFLQGFKRHNRENMDATR